ncbi:hypothetical protein J4460_03340 [Candidatus Woesearchaeota archaeon]|nr:MAG: hypothetical protein QS99_C0008G0038 [archaeon GW2011_AR4]MBS3129682.1 hypothetical protein [Candidatus Woesearchaeota archaeon]HIH38786.1 hypothetical protein [Candidatus Woesearchaeota archaeon]HIH49202.1 hypothetical protein [Candidatus Woesearchaeota archaeon]HIJ03344.1 hypothetical protein [Candidatus Woesearchaeota archaeon]
MIIKELKLRRFHYKSRKGLSERLLNAYLKKRGYQVYSAGESEERIQKNQKAFITIYYTPL